MHRRFLNIREVLSIVVCVFVNVLINDDVIGFVWGDRSPSGAWTTGNGRRKVFRLQFFVKFLCVRGERE